MMNLARQNRLVFHLAACVTLLALAGLRAEVRADPFKITGSGVAPSGLPLPGQEPRPHTIVGNATYLGRHTGEGTVKTDSAVFDPVTGHIVGEFGSGSPFVFKKANGDQLACNYGRTDLGASKPGTFDLT